MNKKINKKKQENEELKKLLENKQKLNTKVAPITTIEETVKRLHDDALRRKYKLSQIKQNMELEQETEELQRLVLTSQEKNRSQNLLKKV
jgi:hypothetical protein